MSEHAPPKSRAVQGSTIMQPRRTPYQRINVQTYRFERFILIHLTVNYKFVSNTVLVSFKIDHTVAT